MRDRRSSCVSAWRSMNYENGRRCCRRCRLRLRDRLQSAAAASKLRGSLDSTKESSSSSFSKKLPGCDRSVWQPNIPARPMIRHHTCKSRPPRLRHTQGGAKETKKYPEHEKYKGSPVDTVRLYVRKATFCFFHPQKIFILLEQPLILFVSEFQT